MRALRNYASAVLIALLLLNATEALASIGKAVDVQQGATLTSAGVSKTMRAGMDVSSGDTVTTNNRGIVQLVFDDGTKIAVGPNARMVIDVSMMRGNLRARNFAVQALGGSFRFISGNSGKRAYKITTPNATMGIRGTFFDFWVDGDRQTAMVIMDGRVRMCKPGGKCALIRGRCALAISAQQARVPAAATREQAARVLRQGFPFVRSQSVLQRSFRAGEGGCSKTIRLSKSEIRVRLPVPPPPPPPPPPPVPEPPAPEPPADTGFPGNSGNQGPSQGKGNEVANGQNGTGTGNGQGASNGNRNRGSGNGNGRGHGNGKNK